MGFGIGMWHRGVAKGYGKGEVFIVFYRISMFPSPGVMQTLVNPTISKICPVYPASGVMQKSIKIDSYLKGFPVYPASGVKQKVKTDVDS